MIPLALSYLAFAYASLLYGKIHCGGWGSSIFLCLISPVAWAMVSLVMAFPSGLIIGQILKLSGRTYSDDFINSALTAPTLLVAILVAFFAHGQYTKKKPNQSLQTTTMAVTDAAAQPPRQP
jgi:hypothetical protein